VLSAGNTTTGVIFTEATAGAMVFADPPGGQTSYIMGGSASSTVSVKAWLYDRIYGLGALTPTSGAYAGITGLAIDRPADGAGCMIAAEIVTAFSATAHTATITYINQAGVGGRTATVTIPASAPVARVFFAALETGDSGVQQITAVSGSSAPTGTFNLLIIRPLLMMGLVAAVPRNFGIPESGLRPLYPNTCGALLVYNPAGTTAATIELTLDLTTG
jgi:hypothetical protein